MKRSSLWATAQIQLKQRCEKEKMAITLTPGRYIASNYGTWWEMSNQQDEVWTRYESDFRWRHEGMGATVWMGEAEVEYAVDGYRVLVRRDGSEYMCTSDGLFREVLVIRKPTKPWAQLRGGAEAGARAR